MKRSLLVLTTVLLVSACVTVQPLQWSPVSDASENEYQPYFQPGSATVSGQAFLTQRNGGVVKAAGREVTLDPATSTGAEWWSKAGRLWVHRQEIPPSPSFTKARRKAIADADGRFTFSNLPPGKYYVRTEVTWEIGGYYPTQGGLVGQEVTVADGQKVEAILNSVL